MAIDKAIDSTLLNASCSYEAGKIRAKLGSSAQINYDLANGKGFGDAIEAIQTGGGTDYMAQNIQGTLTSYESNDVTVIRSQAFRECPALTTLKLHSVTEIKSTGIYGCSGLTALAFPSLSGSEKANIRACVNLAAVDLGAGLSRIGGSALDGNTLMAVLILRRTDSITALGNINAFNNTPFASGKAGGILYVPNALISAYQSATNWSTILGYANNSITAIEGSQYENAYADGTPIT